MPTAFSLARAGRWFLVSGIQEESGGVARFYDASEQQNRPVSTEITGYTASALAYLYEVTGHAEYLERAIATANFLMDRGWNEELQTFPFEWPSPSAVSEHQSFFFDNGIIIRGLLAVWHHTKEDRLIDLAGKAAHSMLQDFFSGGDYHPILQLPAKAPMLRDARWSRSAGCYQLKSALAWFDLAEITGDETLKRAFRHLLEASLNTHASFLPSAQNRHAIMDRLHAYNYFLEALGAVADRADCREAYVDGIGFASENLNAIAPEFVRSDVYAQLLRARLNAELLGVCPVDREAASKEAEALAEFQVTSEDVRIDGGFRFGRRNGALVEHVNPVSTAFALQALEMWAQYQAGTLKPCRALLI